jgi:hypothetical protein
MSTYVLEPCPLPECFNKDLLKERLPIYFSEERREVNPGNLKIESDYSEYWTAKATGGKRVGAGSEGTDVITPAGEGIDATCLCIASGNSTNEKSLRQGLVDSKALAICFDGPRKSAENAAVMFREKFGEKLVEVITKFSLKVLYLLVFVSSKETVRLICFRYNVENTKNISTPGFTQEGKSIYLDNIIDKTYGKTMLYSSKHRIELRLTKAAWEHPYSVEVFTIK